MHGGWAGGWSLKLFFFWGGWYHKEGELNSPWMLLGLKIVCFVVLLLKLADTLATEAKSLPAASLLTSGLRLEERKGQVYKSS